MRLPLCGVVLAAAFAAGASGPAASGQVPLLADERPRLPGRVGLGAACVVADFDGDARQDIARVSEAGLDVLLQEPTGAFRRARAAGPMPLGLAPGAVVVSLAAGRLRPLAPGPDLVVGLSGADSLLLENLGSGAFRRASTFQRGGFLGATSQVLVADLDRAPGDDVLVLHDGGVPQLFLQLPGGGFALATRNLPSLVPQSPVAVLGDFDGRLGVDVVMAQRGTIAPPVLLANDGAGVFAVVARAFASWTVYPISQLRAVDLDGDGDLDVVAAPGQAAAGGPRLLVNNGNGAAVEFAVVSPPGLAVGAIRDLEVGDLDANRRPDLVLLQQRGDTLLARQAAAGQFGLTEVLGEASRAKIALVDLEGDGDLDLYALGHESEDRLLLGDGGGGLRDTEEKTVPLEPPLPGAAPVSLALVDATGEGDPEILGYAPSGVPLGYANDGSGRFRLASVRLPPLIGQVGDVQGLSVAPAVATAGGADLAVLVTPPVGPTDLRILVRQAGGYQDQTALRWPSLSPRPALTAFVAGDVLTSSGGPGGLDDIVAIDARGQPYLFVNQNGVFREHGAPFPGVAVAGAVKLALGKLNGDALPDVVIIGVGGPPLVFLGSSSGVFTQVVPVVPGSFPARDCAVADVDGDALADLLVLAPPAQRALYFFKGLGDGRLALAATASSLLPASPSSLAVIRDARRAPAIVVGSSVEADVVLRGTAPAWSAEPLPGRGSPSTARLLVGDLDIDGDEDLVAVRLGHQPQVLFNQSLQLTQLGVTQLGRPLRLRLRAPAPGAAAIFLGAQTRLPLAGWGLLRIHPAGLTLLGQVALPAAVAPAAPLAHFELPTSRLWPELTVPFQAVHLSSANGRLSLTNCEPVDLLRR